MSIAETTRHLITIDTSTLADKVEGKFLFLIFNPAYESGRINRSV